MARKEAVLTGSLSGDQLELVPLLGPLLDTGNNEGGGGHGDEAGYEEDWKGEEWGKKKECYAVTLLEGAYEDRQIMPSSFFRVSHACNVRTFGEAIKSRRSR